MNEFKTSAAGSEGADQQAAERSNNFDLMSRAAVI